MPAKQTSRSKKLRTSAVGHGRQVKFRLTFEALEERALMAVLQGGDVVVYRVGDPSGDPLANTGNQVFMDEYTPSGTLVQSIALPTSDSGSNHALIASGTAVSEGGLSRSTNGQYLVFLGYDDTPPAAGSLSGLPDARTVGRLAIDGTVDTSTLISSFPGATTDNPRSVASDDGTHFWASGGKSGLEYVTLGSFSGTALTSAASTNSFRNLVINNGQLYVSSQSSGFSVATVGSGLPTSGSNTITNLPGMPITGSHVSAFFFAHLNTGVGGTAPDTLYVTDDTNPVAPGANGQITKYSLEGSNWVNKGSVTAPGIRGLTGAVNSSSSLAAPTVTMYGSTGSGSGAGGSLYAYVDTTGYDVAPTGTVTTIATAGTNQVFRGVDFAPNAAPVLDTSVHPALDGILEDVGNGANTGTLVSDLISRLGGTKISDPGQLKQGIAVTAVDNSNGAWQFSTDAGSNWTAFGTPSGTAARLLASDANTRVRFVPNANFNGSINPAITFRAWDQSTGTSGGTYDASSNGSYFAFSSATNTATLQVTAVNDAPSFVKGIDQSVPATIGAQTTVAGWATSISKGPADESGQVLNFIVTNNTNTGLFSAGPAISPTGTLTFTASGVAGTATITLTLHDNGGTTNGGVDTSVAQTFTITTNATGANQAPVISSPGATQSTLEDTSLAFNSAHSNLISFVDVDALAGDSEQITITTTGGTASLSGLAGLTGSNNGSANFTYTGTVANLNAALNGLTFSPTGNLNGTGAGSIQVLVSDLGHNGTGGTKTDTATVSINITAVNDVPSFVKGPNRTVLEDSGAQSFVNSAISISAGPADEAGQALNFMVTNDNNALFSVQPSVSSAGVLTFTPAPNANGSTTVTLQLHDNGGTANAGVDTSSTQTFTITVNPVNDAPVNAVPSGIQRAVENVSFIFSTAEVNAISVSDVDDNGSGIEQVTLTATHGTLSLASLSGLTGSGNGTASLTYSGTLANLNAAINGLVFTPANNYTGAATVQITTNDLGNAGQGGALNASNTINLNIVAPSPLLINELFFNPPGQDEPNSYLEFRSPSTTNYAIPSGTYLISVTGQPRSFSINNDTYPTGTVIETFDLSGAHTGSNGMLVILQKDNTYVDNGLVDPHAAVLDNTGIGTGAGFGNNLGSFGSSIVGHNALVRTNDVDMIHPSATYLLVHANSPISPGDNLDPGLTGTLSGDFTVLDSVSGLTNGTSSPGDNGYGFINFSDTRGFTNTSTPNSLVVPTTGFTPSYIGRSGNTLGWQASDWVAGDHEVATSAPEFGLGDATSVVPVSFGTRPLNHIGAANFDSNIAPVVVTTATNLTYSSTNIVVADAGVTVTDTDSSFLSSAKVAISGYVSGDDHLGFSDTLTISGNFDIATGILTLTGFDTAANYQAALRTVTYNNSNGSTPTPSRSLVFSASDGNFGAGAIRKINNQAPAIDLNGAGAGINNSVTWAGAAIPIAIAATVIDVNDPTLASIKITLNSPHAGDVLDADASGTPGISKSFAANVLTLSGNGSIASYQAALRTVTYHNTSGGPGVASETVNVVANDGLLNSSTAVGTINISNNSTVAARKLFYADSAYDGYSGIPAIAHDEAIAPDKAALLPGAGENTFANVSGYTNGINGIMIDLTAGGNHAAMKVNAASDFTFKVSGPFASNSPSTWTTLSGANLPSVLVRPAGSTTIGGVLANDRIELLWPDQKILGTWLEVIVKANADSGLAANDVFYFGSSPGDTGLGNDPDASFVDATDEISARNHQESDLSLGHTYTVAVSNIYDVNKDDQVDATDQIYARNFGNSNGELDYISIPLLGPFTPATGGAGAAVASALSTAMSTSSGSGGSWAANSLSAPSSGDSSAVSYFAQLGEATTPSVISNGEEISDDLGLDDELLDALTGGSTLA